MDSRKESEQESKGEIIIHDLRHSRDEDGDEELEEQAATEPETQDVEETPEPQGTAPPTETPAKEPTPATQQTQKTHTPTESGEPETPLPQGNPAEMEQLKLIFDAGLTNYLGGQLGILINFALISLGRAPNPATGLVATDMAHAKLAIDLLEVMARGLKDSFPKEEITHVNNVVGELKYTFLQAAANSPGSSEEPEA